MPSATAGSRVFRGERTQGALILFTVAVLWALFAQLAYDQTSGTYSVFNPDTYATLIIARTFAHGHPWRLNPTDPPCTMLSDLLSPMFFSIGYWLGFKDPSSFVLWSYLASLLLAGAGALAMWRFFRQQVPSVAFPAVILCLAFPGIFVNIFSTNFGLLFVFFWAAMASLDSFPRFVVCAVLAGLVRPEGVLMYAFLSLIFISTNGRAKAWRLIPGIAPLMVPHLIYLHRTGSLMPQGVVPQNIIRYHGLTPSLGMAMATASDQIKGAILGIFPAETTIGAEGSAWIGALPPLVFLLGFLGLFTLKRSWAIGTTAYVLLLVAADSFTTFSGVHYNRHLHVLTPLFFAFALSFLSRLARGRPVLWTVAGSWAAVVALQLVASLAVARSMVRLMAVDRAVAEHVVARCPDCRVFDISTRTQYWADDRLPWHTLTPAVDPHLGRYVKYFHRLTEMGEYVQRLSHGPVAFIHSPSTDLLQEWLLSFQREELASFVALYTTVQRVSLLDLAPLHDAPACRDPVDELDVGDAESEHTHRYRFVTSLPVAVGGFPHEGDGFFDGGRPSVVREAFDLTAPPDGMLVARYRGDYEGRRLRLPHSPVHLSRTESMLTITADGDTVFHDSISFSPGFSHVMVPLKVAGKQRIVVEGVVNSFHYWSCESSQAENQEAHLLR